VEGFIALFTGKDGLWSGKSFTAVGNPVVVVTRGQELVWDTNIFSGSSWQSLFTFSLFCICKPVAETCLKGGFVCILLFCPPSDNKPSCVFFLYFFSCPCGGCCGWLLLRQAHPSGRLQLIDWVIILRVLPSFLFVRGAVLVERYSKKSCFCRGFSVYTCMALDGRTSGILLGLL